MKKDQPQRKGRGASDREKASKFSSKKSSSSKKEGTGGESRPGKKSFGAAKKTPAGRVQAGRPVKRKFESSGEENRSGRKPDFKGRTASEGKRPNKFSDKSRDFNPEGRSSGESKERKSSFGRKKFGDDRSSNEGKRSGRKPEFGGRTTSDRKKPNRFSDKSRDSKSEGRSSGEYKERKSSFGRKKFGEDESSSEGKRSGRKPEFRGRTTSDEKKPNRFSGKSRDSKSEGRSSEESKEKKNLFIRKKFGEDSSSKPESAPDNTKDLKNRRRPETAFDKTKKQFGEGKDKSFKKSSEGSVKKTFSKSKDDDFEDFENDELNDDTQTKAGAGKGKFTKKSENSGTRNKPSTDEIRLNRYISNAGVCSRREADVLISDGLIKVNGKVVTEMGYKVKKGETVKYGSKILSPEKLVYVLINKPKDFITTTEDENERKTVMDLVKNVGPERIYPVGRLDRNTTGLLLFTNDGELAEKLMHPSNRTKKLYQAELSKPMSEEDFQRLKNGITLEDGPIKPDQLEFVTPDGWVIGIQVHEGRNRLVRRMFEHLGYEVTRLDRVMYAGLSKRDLPRGHWRHLTEKEIIKLKHLSH